MTKCHLFHLEQAYKHKLNKIEMVQRRAARYVTNRQSNTSSVGDMIQHLKWCSLEDRRRDTCLVMMYKISHDKVAVSFSETFTTPETLQKYALSVISGPEPPTSDSSAE